MFDFVNAQSPKIPVTEETISRVEKEYGIHFPPILRQYYLEHNGQQINSVDLRINEDILEVAKITTLNDPRLSLEQLLHMQRKQNFPVSQMIPIADDRANGLFYLHTGTDIVYFSELNGPDDFLPVCQGINNFFRIMDAFIQDHNGDPYDISKDSAAISEAEWPDFLPQGSIVQLRGTSHKVMIIARSVHVLHKDEDLRFDYGGVVWPNGFTGDGLVYFNREGIEKVAFYGYADKEDEALQIALKQFLSSHPNQNIGTPALLND